MKRAVKVLVVVMAVGLLSLATAVTALAAPPAGVANSGLLTALGSAQTGIAHADFGTANAACNITGHNPATTLVEPGCP